MTTWPRDLAAAIDLYRGDYLSDLVGESWIDERRHQLRRGFERALTALARLQARAGHYDDAIDVLHRAIAQDPLSEATHRELMRCYAAAGQRGAALRQYATLRDLLRTELNTPPAPETIALHDQIRRGEPFLSTPPLVVSVTSGGGVRGFSGGGPTRRPEPAG